MPQTILSREIVGKRESIQDELLLLNPHQTPMLAMLGFSESVNDVERSWFEDKMYSFDADTTEGVEAGATEIGVTDTEPFRVNQIVKIDEEFLLVTGVNIGDKKLTVVRGHAGTDAQSIASGAHIEVMFVEGEEGADARESRFKPRVRKNNVTQIFDDSVSITGTSAAVANYGIDDLYSYEQAKKQLELALQLEKALINGVKYEDGTKRLMRGTRNFIESNVTDLDNGEQLTHDILSDSIQDVYHKGGFKNGGNYEIIVPAAQKRVISKFDKEVVRLNQGENSRGTVVNFITTDFGEFPVSINDNLAKGEVLFVDKNRMRIRPLQGREFSHEFLGKQGDYYKGMIVGEYTLEFVQEAAHARIKNAQ